jgi:hypothetical protein
MLPVTKEIEQEIAAIRPLMRKLTKATNKYFKNKALEDASDSDLKTFCKVLHYIAHGEIHLSEDKKEALFSGKKMKKLAKHFTAETDLAKVMKLNKKQKITLLRNVGHYGDLLHLLWQ